MPISAELKTAYLATRARVCRADAPRGQAEKGAAHVALRLAREGLASGRTYYAPSGPCLTYQPPRPRSGERLAHVEKPEAFGLRYVGQVGPESRRFTSEGRGEGWLTDPFGDVFKDGTGLCYGVVYQLPARDGCARFVAGYQFGGTDGGPTVDLATVYTSESARGDDCKPVDHDDARDAARAADHMAQREAEKEREYQTAWQAGVQFAELGEAIATERKTALALLAEMRAERKAAAPARPAICKALRDAIGNALGEIADARRKRAEFAQGEGRLGGTALCFWPGDSDLQAAFCDGAGLATFPGAGA